MTEKELKEYTADEVSKHTTQDDCWLVIGNQSNGEFQILKQDESEQFILSVCRAMLKQTHKTERLPEVVDFMV